MSVGLLQCLAFVAGDVDSGCSDGVARLLAKCSFGHDRGDRDDQAVRPAQEAPGDAAVTFLERDASAEVFFGPSRLAGRSL